MDEQILDASAIDEFNEYDLTGEASEDSNQSYQDSNELDNSEEDSDSDYEDYSQEESDDSSYTDEDYSDDDDDLFTKEVLRLKGINDPNKIKFEDESGAIIERSWNDLSTKEKLGVLTLEEDTDTDLEDEEIQFINMLRQNNLTPSQYLEAFQSNITQQILDNQEMPYEVDNLTDDELFALDLIEKLGEENVTDEELQAAIEQAKANEALYSKQVQALRDHYKNLENQQEYEQQQAQQYQREQSYRDFSEQVLSQIEGFDTIAGEEIDLSVDDKNDIANYILTRDETGLTDFYKDLQNPQALTTAAFWMLKGPEIMQELQYEIQQAYKRGYAVGTSSKQTAPKVVVTPRTNTEQTEYNTSNDAAALGDDESYLYT